MMTSGIPKTDLHEIVNLPAPQAAPLLLGQRLVHETAEGRVSGIITEVEAYQQDDPASHTFRGQTTRNRVMFGRAGHAYVYFSYGMHWCVNIVTDQEGLGSGVLVRAVRIDEGLSLAWYRRYKEIYPEQPSAARVRMLSNGPGKVTQALDINASSYGIDVLDELSSLKLEYVGPANSRQTPRIGISKGIDTPWRWLLIEGD